MLQAAVSCSLVQNRNENTNPEFHIYTHAHLERLVVQVHFEQRVSDQVSETTAVEIAVWPCVASVIVDLRELKTTKLMQIISMEILVLAEHLLTKKGPHQSVNTILTPFIEHIRH